MTAWTRNGRASSDGDSRGPAARLPSKDGGHRVCRRSRKSRPEKGLPGQKVARWIHVGRTVLPGIVQGAAQGILHRPTPYPVFPRTPRAGIWKRNDRASVRRQFLPAQSQLPSKVFAVTNRRANKE